jgi:uncharacterized MnhB-related membrane protein
MLYVLLVSSAVVCALQAIRATRLLSSAVWLAGVSASAALLLYVLGAYEVAVIELSVGAGLVTVLFVFAITIAGEDAIAAHSLVPKPLAWGLGLMAVVLLAWDMFPVETTARTAAAVTFTQMVWEQRALDMGVQIVLIFAGVLSVLGLLDDFRLDSRLKSEIENPASLSEMIEEVHT